MSTCVCVYIYIYIYIYIYTHTHTYTHRPNSHCKPIYPFLMVSRELIMTVNINQKTKKNIYIYISESKPGKISLQNQLYIH
jgi:hypothetical protein